MKYIILFVLLNTKLVFCDSFLDKGIGYLLCDIQKKYSTRIYMDSTNESECVGNLSYELNQESFKINYSKTKFIKYAQYKIEYAYDQYSIPVDTVLSSHWIRLILGLDIEMKRIFGWVKSNNLKLILWSEYLLDDKALYFEDNEFMIYDTILGKPTEYKLNKLEYSIYPLERVGSWVKVDFRYPTDYCNDEVVPVIKIGWIKYLNSKSRPLLWFWTRGC